MNRLFLSILLTILWFAVHADHITGGEMFYTYSGSSGGNDHYTVTLKLFMRCNSGRQFPNPAVISIFDRKSFLRVNDLRVALGSQENISLANDNPCITDPPFVCYDVGYYEFAVSLPASASGYILSSEVNYRINGISNIFAGQVGATYTCEIPGTDDGVTAPVNTSARFTGSDLVVICTNNSFTYSFAATDADGDELHYYFSSAYKTSSGTTNGVPTGGPPFDELPYAAPDFGSTVPMGPAVTINENTGLISGIGPPSGIYVVTVSVNEIRNGKIIATQRKDLQVNVTDCSIAAASLREQMLCGLSRTGSFNNLSNSPLIVSNDWTIYDPSGNAIHTFSGPTLNYTFPSNGVYRIKLFVNQGQQCADSSSTRAFVFPGLVPDFSFSGICINKPTFFTDRTAVQSGTVNSWRWDFGESSFLTVTDQNPTYTYTSAGDRNVRLIVTTTDGCRDTVYNTVPIRDKPSLGLGFRDTLICAHDVLQLQASTIGIYNWSPAVNIINSNSPTPTVSPLVTTLYYGDLDVNGCVNRDSVLVRVVDHVSLVPMADTVICSTDTIRLHVQSDALHYSWSPAQQVFSPLVQNPLAVTSTTTNYFVHGVIGGCSADGNIQVRTIPYPIVNAGADTMICFNTTSFLHGNTDGNSWHWSPASFVRQPTALNSAAFSPITTSYVLTAFDTRGCPKPSSDSVLVTVLPDIRAFAGRDTSVIIGQPLQLNASEGYKYAWSPATYLSAIDINNPVAVIQQPGDQYRYQLVITNEAGCADTAFVRVKVFATRPTIFVPTAFTPNNDGKNDVLKAIAVGIQSLQYFNVYNRWGQLVYAGTGTGHLGWDGRINGQLQASNTYVWIVKAVDYTGAPYFQKGTVTLIH